MVGRGGPFYTAVGRYVRFGLTPTSRPMLTGRGYNPGRLRVSGSGSVEIGETRCNNGRVDTRCAGVYRLPLVMEQLLITRAAGSRDT